MKSYPEPWPRQYARLILAMSPKQKRIDALEEVPEHIRELVKAHVEDVWYNPKVKPHGPQTN